MPLRERLLPWTAQPQEFARPNPEFAPRFLITAAPTLHDVCDQQPGAGLSATGATKIVNRVGSAVSLNGASGSGYLPSRDAYNILGALTLVWVGKINNYTNDNFLIARAPANGAGNNPFELRTNVTAGTLNLTRADTGSYVSWYGQQPGNSNVVIVVTHAGGMATPVFWVNGVSGSGTIMGGAGSGNGAANTLPLRIGTREDFAAYANAEFNLAAGFDRILTSTEIQAISANPWQLFEPQRIYVPGVVVSGGLLSAATVFNITSTTARPRVTLTF